MSGVRDIRQLALDLDFSPPASTQTDEPPQIDHAEGVRACRPFQGPENRWRQKAVEEAWIEEDIDRPALAWPTPICGTPKCLNLRHLEWRQPSVIHYPNGICVYCGQIADTKDHLLPVTWTGEAVRKHVVVVPACRECNSLISDRYAPAVNERRKLAHTAIRTKYRKILKMPDWKRREIAEMGPTIRSVIERGMHDKKVLTTRINWPADPFYDLRAMERSGIENPYAIGLLIDLSIERAS